MTDIDMVSPFDDYRCDPEARFDFPEGYTVEVATVGGGTVGREYADNTWLYSVTDSSTGEVVAAGADLRIAMPTTHATAARLAMEFTTTSD